jgi:hypothetical protein
MCNSNKNNVLSELFCETTDICGELKCCLKKRENKQSLNPVFIFAKPLYSSTSQPCERKLINKLGDKTTNFFNKNKNLMLECILSGNYSPLIAIIPNNSTLSLYSEDGFPLFASSALIQLPVLSITDFYTINLLDYTKSSYNTHCESNGSSLSFCFKLMAKYTSSVPSAISESISGNIVGIYTIIDPVLPKC